MASSLLAALPPYVFYQLDARRAAARAAGRTLIDVGIGSPDGPIPAVVVEAMRHAAAEPVLSGYPAFRVDPALARAFTAYAHERFGVTLDAAREVMALAGSKEGIAELVLSHVNPGDVVLIPAVHYPVYARAPRLAGARAVPVPVDDAGVLQLDQVAAEDLARARLLVINYPSNPTTATTTLAELGRLLAFAEAHDLVLVSDLAYSELGFDGYAVPSVLQLPGAARRAVELHTCSKSFNMAGVRIAVMAGSRAVLDTVDAYRSNIGYGVSTLAQRAGAAAFAHHAAIVPPIVDEYRRRRDALAGALRRGGWAVEPPRASMYFWLPVPGGMDDWAWVDALIDGPGVVVTPGLTFGEAGRGRFRVSLVQPADRLEAAAAALVETAAVCAAAAG